MKKCYYEILGVDKKATTSQIKTSYRKLALKYHPDKNDSENAKQIFVQLNQAYNVLSDPNQRTWYDNNRQKILFNKEQMSKQDVQSYSFGFNIWNYFTTSCFKGYDDSEGSFFEVYRTIFQKVKSQQAKAYAMRDDLEEQIRKYEGFGVSQTNIQKVIKFYEDWENFTTYKTFIWAEDWDTRQAPNRYVKRQMQKQNKKQRLKEKKTYIKTIKDLISFLKKRDPRYTQYLIKQKEQEEKKQIEKKKREQEKKIEKQKMKKVKQQMEQQRFKQIQQYYKNQNKQQILQHQQNFVQYQEQSQFFCEICAKEFKSENQLRNHQKSKMHKQAVKQLQKQVMSKQQIIQQANKQEQQTEKIQQAPKKSKNKKNRKKKNKQKEEEQQFNKQDSQPQIKKEVKKQQIKQKKKQESQESSGDDTNAFMSNYGVKKSQKQEKMTKNMKKQIKKVIQSSQSEEEQINEKKKGKAKLKKQKKANQQKQPQHRCNVCNQPFPSKTKLFDHIKKTGHAKAK